MRASVPSQAGFTLVELVTVIMVLGILAVGSVRFMTDASNGYASTVSRSALSGDARIAIERLTREVREALPNSVRVTGGGECLELIPVRGASVYLAAPIGYSALSMQVVPIDVATVGAATRVAVQPQGNPYQLSGNSAISPIVTAGAPDAQNEVTLTFTSTHRFPRASAEQRFYLVDPPVSYCVAGDTLWRYSGYGFTAAQSAAAALPATVPGRTMLAERITSAAPYFTVNGATLRRNAVVAIDLEFGQANDTLSIAHLVQMRNVP